MEKKLKKNLRKCQNTLIIVGAGVIVLGLWSVVKTLMFYILDVAEVDKTVEYLIESTRAIPGAKIDPLQVKIGYFGMIMIFSLVEMFFRTYIGRKAMAEGRGRKGGYLYILFSFILVSLNLTVIIGLTYGLTHFKLSAANYVSTLVNLFIEITSMAITVEMAVAAIRFKSISRKLKKLQSAEPPDNSKGTAFG